MSDDNKNDTNQNKHIPMKTAIRYVFSEPTASTVKIFTSVEDFADTFCRLLDVLKRDTKNLKEAIRLSAELIDLAKTREDAEALKAFHQGYVNLLKLLRQRCCQDFMEVMDKRDDSVNSGKVML